MLTDSHSHLQFQAFKNDLDEVLLRCEKKEVLINVVGTQKNMSKKAVELAEKHENIYATIGLHPSHLFPMEIHGDDYDFVSKAEDFDEEYYEELVKLKKVIAIGECGIDLFHLPKNISKEEVIKKQQEILEKQIEFANKNDLPLVIHMRSAHEELFEVLKKYKGKVRGVVHCFTGNWKQARDYLDLGLYLGFTGVITFPPKKNNPEQTLDLLEVVEKCPLDRMLVETDAPYLAPQKYRGKKCEPWMTEEVVKKIGEVRGLRYEEVESAVEENFRRLFGISL